MQKYTKCKISTKCTIWIKLYKCINCKKCTICIKCTKFIKCANCKKCLRPQFSQFYLYIFEASNFSSFVVRSFEAYNRKSCRKSCFPHPCTEIDLACCLLVWISCSCSISSVGSLLSLWWGGLFTAQTWCSRLEIRSDYEGMGVDQTFYNAKYGQ